MSEKNHQIKTAQFIELTSVPAAQTENALYDIIIEGKPVLIDYCCAILEKLFEIPQSQFSKFIEYHLGKVKDPGCWLNKFEKLIANNEEEFKNRKSSLARFTKLYGIIENKRAVMETISEKETKPKTPKRLINGESEERYFSFYETKIHVEKLEDIGTQILFLTEEIFAYKQADLISKNSKLQDYDEQCEKLKERLQTIRKLKAEYGMENSIPKIRLNGPINILTHSFKQMMTTIKPNGDPYLPYKIKDIASFICNQFLDENGEQLSTDTIKTYLSPTRTDKDPNNDQSVKF